MNIYTPIAEYQMAKDTIVRARAALCMETKVPSRFYDGFSYAFHLLDAAEALIESDLKTLREAVAMPPDMLYHAILWQHGHDVYLGEESPLVRSLIAICAAQYYHRSCQDCARDIADAYDRKRLGEDL